MKNLREKLMAVSARPAVVTKPLQHEKVDPYYVKEQRVPIASLYGIEKTTLQEICICDPYFSGKSWDIEKLLFLDTETTGLSGGAGTVAFEIGVGFISGTEMVIRQYVMRDYGEEAAMLFDLAELIKRFDTLVTFNGKTFDIPLLESRMIMQRIRLPMTTYPHFDLLHACRRVYRLRLKRCNLAALEEAVLGVKRDDDLPGAQVPQRYFDYLKTKEFALLSDVLRHNFQDVQSLASLTGHLCSVFRKPEALVHPEDLFSAGRTLERGGQKIRARTCYRILGHSSMSSQARMHLALSYKKEKEWKEVLDSCKDMIAQGEGDVWPYIEAAKIYEHVYQDMGMALKFANSALAYELNIRMIGSRADDERLDMLHRRIRRLLKKQQKMNENQIQEDER